MHPTRGRTRWIGTISALFSWLLLSGSAFGTHGKGYLRLSTAAPRETIEGALAAMRDLLEQG